MKDLTPISIRKIKAESRDFRSHLQIGHSININGKMINCLYYLGFIF